jgi:SAM-dependent methyltransferase
MDSTRRLEQLIPAASEATYDRLTCYRFAQRYVEGKDVADIVWREVSYGSHLLAETARSVTALTNSSEVPDPASASYSAPNTTYRRVDLPDLPFPEDHFDVVVVFGVVENLDDPGDLVREAKRVSKPDCVLVISAPDKQVPARQHAGGGEVYVSEFQNLLEHHFKHVRLFRLGPVAGGFVFPASEEITSTAVESARLVLTNPLISPEPPETCSVIAVCSDVEGSEEEVRPYLLLDRDRRIFDECEDRAEDVQLLREEIERMQETEVQAFQDTLKLNSTEMAYLRAQVRYVSAQVKRARMREEAQERTIQAMRTRIHEMENSTTWRVFNPYRRLRARIDALTRPTQTRDGSSES